MSSVLHSGSKKWRVRNLLILFSTLLLLFHHRVKTAESIRDTLRAEHNGIDTTILFSATDTNRFDVATRTLYLIGKARIQYRNRILEADRISVNFNTGTIIAEADTTKRPVQFARFQEGNDFFEGIRIEYNVRSRKGRVIQGRTERPEGYYGGEIVKQVTPKTYYIRDGVFTTCDATNPHYAFFSSKMRIDLQERFFVDPLFLTIEEFPVFGIPFGFFIDARRGRRSGFLVPSLFFSSAPGSLNRGAIIENLGYYWAINDYLDTRIALRLTTKGGYTLFNETRYALRKRFTGKFSFAYGQTRTSPMEPTTTDWNFQLTHNQKISKSTELNASLGFSSSNFFRNVSTDPWQRAQQQIRSDAYIKHYFANGSSISLYYQRTENLLTGETTETLPQLTFSLPQWYPLQKIFRSPEWLRSFNISYTVTGYRTRTNTGNRSQIRHMPRISLSPKFRFFTLQPSITYEERWYFRKLFRTVENDSLIERFEQGFFREYQYSFGVSLSTRLYGIAYIQRGGVEAVRHILQPTLTWRYTPDFSQPQYGMYGSYRDPQTGQSRKYSHYLYDGGGVNAQLQQSLSFSLDNTFEAKIWKNDTSTTVVRLLNLTLSGTYNAAADSLRFSPITLSARTSIGNSLSFSGSASFLLYKQLFDSSTSFYRTIDRFLLETGEGIARLQYANFTASLLLQGGFGGSSTKQSEEEKHQWLSHYQPGKIYTLDTLFWGKNAPGVIIPPLRWQLNAEMSIGYSAPTPATISRNFTMRLVGSVQLERSWSLYVGTSFDVLAGAFIAPYLELQRSLHCWEFYLRWYPIGISQGIYLRIGIAASQLRDIKIEKRAGSLYFQ